jgi:hypothetical protein
MSNGNDKDVRTRQPLSDEARKALNKLETPDAIAVMEHIIQRAADGDNQNQNNNNSHELDAAALKSAVQSIPTDVLQNVLTSKGIVSG